MRLAVSLLLFVLISITNALADQGDDPVESVSAERAIELLQEGNARFVAGQPLHPHEKPDRRLALESGQHPFAVVVGCADSRVPPELVFDQGLGDLFVIRVAGNVVDTDVVASVEYAADHLGTKLILVMGHTHCGAVTATIDHLSDQAGEPAEVVSLLYRIEPAIIGLPRDLPRDEQIDLAVRHNVRRAVRRLSRVPDLHRNIKSGQVKIVGAIYDMHTGKVEILDNDPARTIVSVSE